MALTGIAQQKASVWRSWPAQGQERRPHPHMERGRQMSFVNHFYLYIWDPEWGPAFINTNAYAPWPVWIYLNGHERGKRQCDKAGIAYEALDNRFRSCEGPHKLQRICDRLGSGAVHRSCGAGATTCRLLSPAPICVAATLTSWPSVSARCPTPTSSTDLRPAGRSSRG